MAINITAANPRTKPKILSNTDPLNLRISLLNLKEFPLSMKIFISDNIFIMTGNRIFCCIHLKQCNFFAVEIPDYLKTNSFCRMIYLNQQIALDDGGRLVDNGV